MTHVAHTIRLYEPGDLQGILEIYNYAIIHTTAVYCYDPFSLADMQDYVNDKKEQEFPLFSAVIDERVVGFATYGTFRTKPGYKHTAEHSVYVHPDFQKKGIAKALMEKLIVTARSNHIHTLIGGVDAENAGSITFHEKLGFKKVAYIKEVGFKFDRWLDLVFMQRIL